jgi:hypothetical protein
MVVSSIQKTIVGILMLTIVFCLKVKSQENKVYPVLSKYRKWSIVGGPVLYDRAKIYAKYGDYTFQNRPIWGFIAGFEYDFFPDRRWSFITGLDVALEPIYSIKYRISKQDLYPHFYEDLVEKYTNYSICTFSAPLYARLNIQANSKVFINLTAGLKFMYYPPGGAYFGQEISNEDQSETREIFGLNLHSQNNSIYGSAIVGTGASLALKKVLLKANLIYVLNFQNTIEGEYQFGNLLSSPPTRGDYKLSGNYWGLWLSISFRKSKNKWIEIMS